MRCQGRGLVSVCVDDGRVSHRVCSAPRPRLRLRHCLTSRYLVTGRDGTGGRGPGRPSPAPGGV
ncbi:hypothetical protein SGM_3290 [Streptomyces griseoaurantiacus M045]|uniref:Uncharacterized protein n=1 Tax=Streptomyces griseoaurantiacus M045 TaxID=996637 RepID=F3NJH6_9ACTN|nr:hypothetical protein SGM_3290 [Streptomyces griseoaurantiacus M045]